MEPPPDEGSPDAEFCVEEIERPADVPVIEALLIAHIVALHQRFRACREPA